MTFIWYLLSIISRWLILWQSRSNRIRFLQPPFICPVFELMLHHKHSCRTIQSENTVCAYIKHNRYSQLTSNFRSIHSHESFYRQFYVWYGRYWTVVFSFWRPLIFCQFLHESFKVKEGNLKIMHILRSTSSWGRLVCSQSKFIRAGWLLIDNHIDLENRLLFDILSLIFLQCRVSSVVVNLSGVRKDHIAGAWGNDAMQCVLWINLVDLPALRSLEF